MRILIVDDSEKWVMFHETAIREIFKDNVIIETANSASQGIDKIHDGIQKGNEMFRQGIDCDKIEFWPLLNNQVKELMVEEDFINIHS